MPLSYNNFIDYMKTYGVFSGIKMLLKNKLLDKTLAFRSVTIHSDDFNADFIVFEPKTRLFMEFAQAAQDANDKQSDEAYEKARHLEVQVFIECVHDEDGNAIFTPEDKAELLAVYGQSHSRIITKAFEKLSIFGAEDAVETAKKN